MQNDSKNPDASSGDVPDEPGVSDGLASPPCMLRELEADERAQGRTSTESNGVARWRRAERRRQIDLRLAMDPAERQRLSVLIAGHLEQAIGDAAGLTVSVYWPMRGEPDLRPLIARFAERGGRCALPVVAEREGPLVFRVWAPGARLERGVWNIPVPAGGAVVEPDVVIAPVVAFDRDCYRLGYGGGYFDRTLASMTPAPRALGVAYACAAVPTIYPQQHDVPMDAIVTELGARRGRCGG